MAVALRYVAYHTVKGTFLGVDADNKPVWSRDPGVKAELAAPSFRNAEHLEEYAAQFNLNIPAGYRLQEVWPHDQNGRVTVEEAANAGLPRWGS